MKVVSQNEPPLVEAEPEAAAVGFSRQVSGATQKSGKELEPEITGVLDEEGCFFSKLFCGFSFFGRK